MGRYRIENLHGGMDLGVYEGGSEAEALDAMAKDAGYESYEHLQATAPAPPGEIRVTAVDDECDEDPRDEQRRDYNEMLRGDFERLGLLR